VTKTRALIASGLAVVAALGVTGVAAGVFRHAGTVSAAPAVGSKAGTRMTVAAFDKVQGTQDRVVVIERTPDGYLCLWDSPDAAAAQGLGGCNPADDPLGGRKLFASLTYDGGPGVASVHDARISGLAAEDVEQVLVAMNDGSTRRVHLAKPSTRAVAGADYNSFAYRVHENDLRRGVTPVAVLATDATGVELDRQPTGIGG
jgi:hypothetical protein